MIVNLYSFQKKKNSTAQPQIQTATTLTSVQLKDSTGIMNPILLINPNNAAFSTPFVPSGFNYAHIPSFGRYYFVNDWNWRNGLWECSLSVDVLASFKTSIGAMSEYILRSSSQFETSISDITYPVTTNYAVTRAPVDLNLDMVGFYVLGIISNSSAVSEGAISYYVMTAAEMANFKSYLMSETFLSANGLASLQEMNKELVKVAYNPFQYIVSCKFFPFAYPSSTGTAVSSINFGWWSIPMTARLISGYVIFSQQSDNFTAGAHPQASRGRYLNHAPYTEIYVIHPMLGTVLLDSNKIEATNTVMITVTADAISGQGVIDITNTTRGIRLFETCSNIAQDIPLAQINTDVIGVARTAISSTGDVISKVANLDIGGAIASAASGVLNTIEASIPVLQASGVNGNKANYYFPADFYTVNRQIVDEDLDHRGRPLCANKTINTLSGFILCADSHFSGNCFDAEKDMVNNYLTSGFYYE